VASASWDWCFVSHLSLLLWGDASRLSSQTNTCLFCTLCPHSCAPGKYFPVGHPSRNCSGPSTLNLGVLWRSASGKDVATCWYECPINPIKSWVGMSHLWSAHAQYMCIIMVSSWKPYENFLTFSHKKSNTRVHSASFGSSSSKGWKSAYDAGWVSTI